MHDSQVKEVIEAMIPRFAFFAHNPAPGLWMIAGLPLTSHPSC